MKGQFEKMQTEFCIDVSLASCFSVDAFVVVGVILARMYENVIK